MNDKKDDLEGKIDSGDDTASLLESLFKDTKSSHIKVVKRRIRPKSGVKKRIVSKKRKDKGEEVSQRQGRPSPTKKSTEITKSKIVSRKTSLPISKATKESKTEQNRRRSLYKTEAGAKPSSKSSKSDDKRIARPSAPKRRKLPPKKIIPSGD